MRIEDIKAEKMRGGFGGSIYQTAGGVVGVVDTCADYRLFVWRDTLGGVAVADMASICAACDGRGACLLQKRHDDFCREGKNNAEKK